MCRWGEWEVPWSSPPSRVLSRSHTGWKMTSAVWGLMNLIMDWDTRYTTALYHATIMHTPMWVHGGLGMSSGYFWTIGGLFGRVHTASKIQFLSHPDLKYTALSPNSYKSHAIQFWPNRLKPPLGVSQTDRWILTVCEVTPHNARPKASDKRAPLVLQSCNVIE